MKTIKVLSLPVGNTSQVIGLEGSKLVKTDALSIKGISSAQTKIYDMTSSNDIILIIGREFTTRTMIMLTINITRPTSEDIRISSDVLSKGNQSTRNIQYKIDGNRLRIWVKMMECRIISMTGKVYDMIADSAPADAIAL